MHCWYEGRQIEALLKERVRCPADLGMLCFGCFKSSWEHGIQYNSVHLNLMNLHNQITSFSFVSLSHLGKSSDPIALAVCESEAFQLSSNLGVAAGYMHKSAEICSSSCNLVKPQQPAP